MVTRAYPPGNAGACAGVEGDVARYGPRRLAAFRALWTAVTRSRRPGSPGIGEQLRALPRMVGGALSGTYPELPRGRLVLFALAIAYLLSPVDLVPEMFLGLLGLTDDAVVALWLGGTFLAESDRFLQWERARPTIVEGGPPQR